ncbi:CAP-Gly domain-containing linker protein 3 isoform X2 [Alosa sapidissima]|nr:CAP-Gly domain-containing linker protein 3 isoform X2 [Alosa sapidissima]
MTREDVVQEPSEGQGRYSSSLPCVERPIIHQVASAPLPSDGEFSFFDPNDPMCREVLQDPQTSVPELFAVLRQWVPQVQKNISLIGSEILKRGCGVNDRDGLTDMSLLHYCCKAGAPGIGDAERAAVFAKQLLLLGAEPSLRSRWTNMSALHYAAYFDVPQLIRVVLEASQPGEVDATCSDFDFGTALHIAASNLCTSAVKCLLELGANPAFRNERGQCPADVVPESVDMPLEMADAAAQAKELRVLLREALPRPCTPLPLLPSLPAGALTDKARVQLASMDVCLGDRVVVAGQKIGTLRFCGSTEFAGGLWAGVELQQPEGKNDGSVAGVQYFTCPQKHGIFAPLSKISKPSERPRVRPRLSSTPVRPPRLLDVSHVTSKVNTGLAAIKIKDTSTDEDKVESPESQTGALSRSCSSSSSSLDSRYGSAMRSRPFPWQRPPLRPRQEHQSLGRRSPQPPSHRQPRQSLSTAPHTGPSSWMPLSGGLLGEGPEFHLGERVLVVGQRTGVVRFCGKTSFAPGFWLGIELDKPSGKNDGSVGGVRYFKCPSKHGVFAPPSRVQRIHGSVDCLSELSSSRLSHPTTGIRRSFSTSTAISTPKEQNRKSPVSRNRSSSVRRRWSTASAGYGMEASGRRPSSTGGATTTTTTTTTASSNSDKMVKLHVGMQVLLSSASEMGTIRYVGTADFAPGMWLGLELRSPRGKNDGSVDGRRYFSCRSGYGVLVRPSRITYRGISGAKLMDESS